MALQGDPGADGRQGGPGDQGTNVRAVVILEKACEKGKQIL